MSDSEAMRLRGRAQRLRRLAVEIEGTSAMSLERHAGADTWRGSRALFCVNLLRSDQARLHHAADELRTRAMLFDRQAAELDRQATMQTGRAS